MSWRQLCLPVLVRTGITPLQHALQLLVCPCVEIDRFDFRDVRAHAAVNSRASNAYEDAEVPTGPSRVCVAVSIRIRLWRNRFRLRLFLLQSEHVLLLSSLTRFLSVARFCSARSAAGLGRRDMVKCGVEGRVRVWRCGRSVCAIATSQVQRKLRRRHTNMCIKGTGVERDVTADLATLSWCPNVSGFAAWHGYSATSVVDWLCLTFVLRTMLVQQSRITCQMY
jgi:hypothetical protein